MSSLCVIGHSQTWRTDCDVKTFAAPFACYPGYVISATRSRDQHVIVIVLTRPAPTDSRLVRKLLHTLTTLRHQNYAKYHQKHSTAEDRNEPSSFFGWTQKNSDIELWWSLNSQHWNLMIKLGWSFYFFCLSVRLSGCVTQKLMLWLTWWFYTIWSNIIPVARSSSKMIRIWTKEFI